MASKTGPKLAVIGTINFDSVTRADKSHAQGYGGIVYNLQVLSQLTSEDTLIFPTVNIGKDREIEIRALLSSLPHVRLDAVRTVRKKNNHCHLRYSSIADKSEVLRGWVGGVSRQQLWEILDSKIILVNFISGSDISTANLRWLRGQSRSTIYMDFHSRTLGRRSNGERFFRRPRDWRETVKCADILQLNDLEFKLLSGDEADPESCRRFLLDHMSASAIGLLVTLGKQGCLAASRSGRRLEVESIIAKPLRKVIDTTGCGDIFAGAFVAAWLRGLSFSDSARFAVRAATYRASRDELSSIDFKSVNGGLGSESVAF